MIKSLFSTVRLGLLYFPIIVRNIFSINELKRARASSIMLICHDVDRGFLWEGVKYAQLLDSINDRLMALGISTISVSAPFSKKSKKNYGSTLNVNGLILRALIFRRLRSLFFKKSLNKNHVVFAWSSLLDQINPKIIIGIQPSAELCIAAKAKGIWVADLQHGILSDEGYYGLFYRKKINQTGWPSCILCWDYASLIWVKNNTNGHVGALLIGNPWIVRFINNLEGDRLVSSTRMKLIPSSKGRLRVLITPQWGRYYYQHRPIGLPSSLLNFIKQSGQEFDWWIRIHPVILNDVGRENIFIKMKQEFTNHPNVYWEHATDLPLPQILAEINLHVTLSSAVTIEASYFGIPSALLGDNVEDLKIWFRSEIKDGNAEIVKLNNENIALWFSRHKNLALNKKKFSGVETNALDNFIDNINICVHDNARIEELF